LRPIFTRELCCFASDGESARVKTSARQLDTGRGENLDAGSNFVANLRAQVLNSLAEDRIHSSLVYQPHGVTSAVLASPDYS
jgi:hypothetical protein